MKNLCKKLILFSVVLYIFVITIVVCKQVEHINNLEKQIAGTNYRMTEIETRMVKVENNIDIINTTLEEKEKETEQLFYLSDYERQVAEKIVMGESKGEPYDGQVLVAQCLLNACLKDNLQPSEVRSKYKYSGWDENPSQSVKNAVSAVFDDGYKIIDEFVLYFYAPKYAKGGWHETQRFIAEVGGHRFFAEWDK